MLQTNCDFPGMQIARRISNAWSFGNVNVGYSCEWAVLHRPKYKECAMSANRLFCIAKCYSDVKMAPWHELSP